MRMKKMLLLLCLALSLVLATAGVADEVPAGLIGEWVLTGMEGDDSVDTTEFESTMIFTETEVTITVTASGESQSMTAPYTFEDNAVMVEVNGMTFEIALEGDMLTVFDGYVSGDISMDLVYTRVGAPPAADASALSGRWEVTSLSVRGVPEEIPSNVSLYYIFDDTTVTWEEYEDDVLQWSTSVAYTVDGDVMTAAGASIAYTLQGDTLILQNETEAYVCRRVSEGADASALLGEWVLLGPADDATAAVMPEGYTATITITEETVTSAYVMNGEEYSQTAAYTLEDDVIVSEVSEMTWVLEDGVLTLTEFDMSLQFVRADSPIGVWTLVDVSGEAEFVEGWKQYKSLGATVELTITADTATLTLTASDTRKTELGACVVEGNSAIIDDGAAVALLQEGVLTLQQGDNAMTFTRK